MNSYMPSPFTYRRKPDHDYTKPSQALLAVNAMDIPAGIKLAELSDAQYQRLVEFLGQQSAPVREKCAALLELADAGEITHWFQFKARLHKILARAVLDEKLGARP